MDQEMLNLLATTAAEFHALGDDRNSEKIMETVGWLVKANGWPQAAFDQANALYISLRDLPLTDIPDARRSGDIEKCFAAMKDGSEKLMAGGKLLTECVNLLRDYWTEHNANRE